MSSARSSRMLSQETSASPVPSSPATGTPSLTDSKHDEQTPTPESPSPTISLKRPAAQFDLTSEEEKRYTPRPVRRQSRNSSYDSSAELCVCPPEAKIPRPRNAFILYRQHHQAGIVAKHPTMTNPDISKVIGEQWNKASPEVKEEWKRLADEEAIRHQRQYPGYRYQPRRPGSTRKASIAESPALPPSHCQKCGGFSNDPQTPTASTMSQRIMTPISLQPDSRQSASSANFASPSNRMIRPAVPTQLPLAPASAARSTDEHHHHHHQLTPDPKRRRLTIGTYGQPHVSTPVVTTYPPSAPHFRDSFGHADPSTMRYVQPSPHSMGPPPRPYQPPSQLRGPILTPVTTNNAPTQQQCIAQPPPPPRMQPTTFLTRLTLLNRISPPFTFPKPVISSSEAPVSSQLTRKRGALVSFEGDDPEAVTQAVNWLGEFLCRSDEYKVRTAAGPRVIAPGETVSIIDYLDLIRDWHDKSKEMIEFITSASSLASEVVADTLPTTELSDGVQARNDDDETVIDLTNGTHSNETAPVIKSAVPATISATPLQTTSTTESMSESTQIPLILLRRYQLHASNTFAQHIPLGPTYTPIDHWQWMATLWRGTLGPDITVYVKDYDQLSLGGGVNGGGPNSANSGGPHSVNGGGSASVTSGIHELLTRNKGVEVLQEKGLVVVWKKKGAPVEEAALRRVAFEVGEGARGVWEGR